MTIKKKLTTQEIRTREIAFGRAQAMFLKYKAMEEECRKDGDWVAANAASDEANRYVRRMNEMHNEIEQNAADGS